MKVTTPIRTPYIALILLVLSFIAVNSNFSHTHASELPVLVGIGGTFSAIDSNNHKITEADLKGAPTLLAFGYTNCADICPITVGYMRNIYENLTPDEQKQVHFVFVTVDPEYDTPAHLNAYLSHFNPGFIGITGTREQVDKIVHNFKVDYRRLSNQGVPTKYIRRIEEKETHQRDSQTNLEKTDHASMGHDTSTTIKAGEQSQLYTHSAHLFVLDKDAQTRRLAHTGTPRDELIADIRHLIAE